MIRTWCNALLSMALKRTLVNKGMEPVEAQWAGLSCIGSGQCVESHL